MRWTIRAKLVTLVLGVLALLVAGAAWSFWLDQRIARAQSQEALLAVARSSAHQLDALLSGRIESLRTLAAVRVLDRLQAADLAEMTEQAQATQPFVSGFLAPTPERRVTVSSAPPQPRALAGPLEDPALPHAVQRRE